jgi:hypothetical protein
LRLSFRLRLRCKHNRSGAQHQIEHESHSHSILGAVGAAHKGQATGYGGGSFLASKPMPVNHW